MVDKHVMTPNLESNQRAADANRLKKHPPLTKDLNYHVNDSILQKRVHTPILSSKPFNPLEND